MENKTVGTLILIAIIITGIIFGLSYFNNSRQNRYTSKEYGFSIIFPQGWLITEGGQVIVQALNKQEDNKVNMNIAVKPIPPEAVNDKKLDLKKLLTAENLYQKESIQKSGTIDIGGEPGFWVQFSIPYSNNGQTIQILSYQAWCAHKNKLFAFTAVTIGDTPQDTSDKYLKYESAITNSISSLRFKN